MKRTYEVTEQTDKRAVAEFLKREGQFLLPMVELVERAEVAIDEVIEVMGRATIEAVLDMSAEAVAGPKQAGKARKDGRAGWYGRQGGQVYLAERKVHVERPRLRTKGQGEGGELEVPAYLAMQRPGPLADRMLEILLAGVSTRRYGEVIGEMADTVGVSKSAVSRETNLIDSTHSGVRQKTRRVTNWKNGAMALRWAATSFVETEKSYRRIIGHDQLWMLKAHLDDLEPVAEMTKAG